MPFLPAWLESRGLDSRQIGIALAAPLIVRLLAVPIATRLADRFALLRPALIAASAASIAGFTMVGISDGFVMILVALSLASAFATPILPLSDAYALRGLGERRRAYGPVRLWGSVSFIAANLAGGVVLQLAGAGNVMWTIVATLIITAGAAVTLRPLSPKASVSGRGRAAVALWSMPAFVAVLAASALIQASHAVMYGFSTIQWTARGLDGLAVGVLWSIGVVAEIILFAFSGRIVPRVGALSMIALGGAGAVLRWGAMALDPPTAALPFLQCLHGLSFGATHLGTMAFLATIASHGRGATAQGDYVAVQGIVFAAGMGLSGVLVAAFGEAAYAAMALAAAIGTGIAIAARRLPGEPDRP